MENTYIDDRTLNHQRHDEDGEIDAMDCDEALERSRSLWDLSQCAESLSSIL